VVDLRRFRDLPAVALIRDLLRRWWGLELAFADPKGYVLDHADGKIFPSQNELCRLALFSKEGFRRCNESVKVVADHLKVGRASGPGEPPTAFVHECHLGFDVVAAPLWFGGELAGFVFTGGSVRGALAPIATAELLRKVREFTDVEGDGERAVADIPQLSEAELEHLKDLVAAVAAECVRAAPRFVGGAAPAPGHPFTEIVGASPAVRDVLRLLEKIVKSESTVLIHGESGTGKELIARAIHYHGPRAKKPFVVQNCSAFNDNLLESALFGHVRGAFTGAVKDQAGLFQVADGGTFFLDEIGDMSPALQVKLLRVLQEGTFTPVGGTKPVKVDVRIIAASHKDLAGMVATGSSARTCSTGSTSSRSRCRRCASARPTSRRWSATSSASTRRPPGSPPRTCRGRPTRRWRCWSATRGRATSASSRTRSSARWSWAATPPRSAPSS
jgi:two-component system response regulator HupR/HoxA